MKYTLLILVILVILGNVGYAQNPTRAIGVRASFGVGEDSFAGGEFSFQKDVGKIGRRETDFGWWSSLQWDVIKFTALRQWKIIHKKRFNFYGGVGFGAGYQMFSFSENEFFATANMNIGLDYTFGFPIQIAFDWRPEWTIINSFGTRLGYDIGLAVRFGF